MRALIISAIGLLSIGCASEEASDVGDTLALGGQKASSRESGPGGSATSSRSTKRTSGATNGGSSGQDIASDPTGGRTAQSASSSSRNGTRASGGSSGVGGSREATSAPKTPAGGAFSKSGTPAGGTGSKSEPLGTGGSRPTGGSTSGVATTTASTEPLKPLQKFVGNITTSYNGSADFGGMTYSKYWDQITPENAGKWGSVQSTPSSDFNWKTLDAIYDYTQKNNIVFKQHAFIWGVQQPSGTPTAAQVQTWMKEFCKRYPATRVIDVVNEPPPHTTPNYVNNMGGGTNGDWKWIANAFTWAREACPNAVLVLNDFNDIEWSADNQRMIDIVKKIKAQNAPIDAIGAQAHDLDHGSVSSNTVMSLIQKLHNDTGLPIYITEMDIDTSDDARQLSLYKTFMPYFLETEWIHGVTIWGWHYGHTWGQAPNSGLVRDGKFRSAMTWLMETLGRPTS